MAGGRAGTGRAAIGRFRRVGWWSGVDPAPTEVPRRAVRERDVRRTVDLSPAQHRRLDVWQREAADQLGYARVTGQEVLSALVDLLLDDRDVSARVMRMLPGRR